MSKTKVYPVGGYGHLCINVKGRQPRGIVDPGKEYEALRDELIMKLSDLRDGENGRRVIDSVRKREEVYSVFPEHTPDLIISWGYGYSFVGESEMRLLGMTGDGDELFVGHRWSGNHRPNGIMIMSGEHINRNVHINDAEIVDVAPTVLALMSISVPDDLDGKVLVDVIDEAFLKENPIRYRKSEERTPWAGDSIERGYTEKESEEIRKKLSDLGYME